MGREQGDSIPNAVVYVRTNPNTDKREERKAFTDEEALNLEARGWAKKSQNRGKSAPVAQANTTRTDLEKDAKVSTEGNDD